MNEESLAIDTTVVIDLETPRTFQDVGGHHHLHLLGISVCGVYFYETDTYRAFRVEQLPEFEAYLKEHHPVIVGFNHRHFDLPILQPYLHDVKLSALPTIDIMAEIEQVEGFRLKLDTLAQGTLLEGKSGDGLDAVRYYRRGEWDKLEQYCLQDVRLTKELYDYGKMHGKLYYQSNSAPRAVPVSWGGEITVSDLLEQAFKEHQQVEVTMRIQNEGETSRITTIADLHAWNPETVRLFSHVTQEELKLPLRCITHARVLQSQASVQRALF